MTDALITRRLIDSTSGVLMSDYRNIDAACSMHGVRWTRPGCSKADRSQPGALAHSSALDRSYVEQVECGERNITLDNIYWIAGAQCIGASDLVG
jgi:hypothetical protein